MDDLLTALSSFQLTEQTVFLGLILIATVLLIMSVALIVVGTKAPIQRQLEEIRKAGVVKTPSTLAKKRDKIHNTLESIAPIMSPKNIKERESVRHQLMHAGYHEASALTTFYALKVLSTLAGVSISALMYFLYPDMKNLKLIVIFSVAMGLFLPNFLLDRMVKKRKSRIKGGIPDALDLLVVCTESGLGFNAALRRVADELMISHPDLADELDTVCAKIKAGVEMSEAMAQLVERTGLTEISGLVSMLAHASRIGGSISQTLRDYTEDFRDKRNQEVEEIAAKIPTKMIFPLLLFVWPCFFIVAVGPSMLSLTAHFGR
ncbi:type II secretion system F family protein [Vibrio sp. Vb2880]|uniref:type II secretion system F family protein n=1 Tax=Vibrio sp. Vb2880 TaxID=2816076 RepID=UPI001A90B689|nr:type II secretion system F family protein [Vibrio sp. Vb2880]MBO0214335.1 type II secretion system F family protein [Vibrio sp. Vb2880]